MYATASWRRSGAALLLIVSVGIAAYANTFRVPFTFDDKWSFGNAAEDLALESFFSGADVFWGFQPRLVGYLTFSLNYRFGGLDVTGYHVVNLLIHLTAAVLVYVLLHQTFRTPYFKAGSGGEAGSGLGSTSTSIISFLRAPHVFVPLFAALLFVAHPVQTQAVTYIVQRFTSLSAMFYLLAMVLYVAGRLRLEARGARHESRVTSHGYLLFFAGSVLAALLAMRTKEIAVTLPLAIVLYEVFFFRGDWKRRLFCLLPLLATLPVVPVGVLFSGESSGDILADIGERSRESLGLSRLDYLFTQFRVIVTYLRLLILPVNQNLDYDYPVYNTFLTPPVFLSFLLLAGLFALAIYLFCATRKTLTLNPQHSTGAASGAPSQSASSLNSPELRLIAFGILWFFLTLAVESSIIPIRDVIFEHRLYLPLFGAATAFATAAAQAAERLFRRAAGRWLAVLATLMVAGLAIATFQRNQVWGSELSLWQDVVAKSPGKGRAVNNLGVALEHAGRRAEAAEAFSRAIEIDPYYHKSYFNLADLYLVSDQPEKSLPLLQAAIRIKPDFTEAYVKLGAALLRGGRFQETAAFLERNLDRVGSHAEARFYIGAAYAFLGNQEAAQRELAVVSRLDARFAAQLAGLLRRNTHGFSHGRN